jgi:putative transcriptional regulator
MTDPRSTVRRCAACGRPMEMRRSDVDYPESGLSNVQLMNVPVWTCEDGHREIEIPATEELHDLLAELIVRKPGPLSASEVRFVRRQLKLSAKDFGARIGLSQVHVSRIENGKRRVPRATNLLLRLFFAQQLASRRNRPFPRELEPVLDQLEQLLDVGEHRLKHLDLRPSTPGPTNEWQIAN